jgi:hypothetical protein
VLSGGNDYHMEWMLIYNTDFLDAMSSDIKGIQQAVFVHSHLSPSISGNISVKNAEELMLQI